MNIVIYKQTNFFPTADCTIITFSRYVGLYLSCVRTTPDSDNLDFLFRYLDKQKV